VIGQSLPLTNITVGTLTLSGFLPIPSTLSPNQAGFDTKASGNYSHSEGEATSAYGDFSHIDRFHLLH